MDGDDVTADCASDSDWPIDELDDRSNEGESDVQYDGNDVTYNYLLARNKAARGMLSRLLCKHPLENSPENFLPDGFDLRAICQPETELLEDWCQRNECIRDDNGCQMRPPMGL
jgi:hypothetical protein